MKYFYKFALSTLLVMLAFLSQTSPTNALTGSEFQAGNIIHDTVFFDPNTLTAGEIQTFLNAKVPSCDTWGTQPSGRSGYPTRADWGRVNGVPPPYTCLRDYTQSIPGSTADSYCPGSVGGGTKSAAQIIKEVSAACGVNPNALIVLLQKEQSLITDDWPWPIQYRSATGYGCPDTAPCDTEYYGFFNQVYNAARQFQLYAKKPELYNFRGGVSRNILYNPATSCGSSSVYLQNQATAGLYNYTPYQPNQAALNNLYGTGDSCSAYGNRNFWRMFNNWFGTTQPAVVISSPLRISTVREGYYTNSPVTVSFDIANNLSVPVDIGGMAVGVRDSFNNNFDYGLQYMTVPARTTITYTSTRTLGTEGFNRFWITNIRNGSWSDNYPVSSNSINAREWNMFIQAMPSITSTPISNITDMRQGKTASFSFIVRNNSQWPLDIGKLALAIRDPIGNNVDLPLQSTGQLAGFSSFTYTSSFTPAKTGTYKSFITITRDNGANWNETSFPATQTGTFRTFNFTVNSSPTITQSPTFSSAPRVGKQVTASFKVKNHGDQSVNIGRIGLAVRDPMGRNVDAGSVDLNLDNNSEYTFSVPVTYTTPGTYTAWITNTRDGGQTWDDTSYPALESSSISRRITFTVLPNPTITTQPTITSPVRRVGSSINATFTVHNFGDSAVNIGGIALAVRGPNNENLDCTLQNVTVISNQDYVYNCTKAYTTPGTYTAWITNTRDGGQTWDDTSYPALESSSIFRRITFTVLPNPTITSGPSLNTPSPRVGQSVNWAFTITNFTDQSVNIGRIGLAVRDPMGRNVDAGSANVTLGPNGDVSAQYTFSASSTYTTPGTYTAWITNTRDGGVTWDDTSYPALESSNILRKITFNVSP